MNREIRSFTLAPDIETYTRLVAHRIDCEMARWQAKRGDLVCTLMDCKEPLDEKIERHDCLKEYAN